MTTTQIRQSGGSHVTGTTVSVTNASPTVTDSANGFVQSDVGRAITMTGTSGRKVLLVTSAGTMVMDGNASATAGPQVCTMAPVLTNVTKKAGGYTDKATAFLPQLPAGAAAAALHAINVWVNCGGVGTHAVRCAKVLAAQGLLIQET